MFSREKQTHAAQRFSFPDSLPEKPLADSTKKLYTSKLNKLAKFGLYDPEKIIANQSKVIAIARDDSGIPQKGSEDDKPQPPAKNQKMRTFLSAVFWALGNVDNAQKIELYNEFQRHKEVNQKFITL